MGALEEIFKLPSEPTFGGFTCKCFPPGTRGCSGQAFKESTWCVMRRTSRAGKRSPPAAGVQVMRPEVPRPEAAQDPWKPSSCRLQGLALGSWNFSTLSRDATKECLRWRNEKHSLHELLKSTCESGVSEAPSPWGAC